VYVSAVSDRGTVPCASCGGASAQRFTVRGFRVHRCEACDLEFVHPLPAPAELSAVYSEGYFSGEGPGYADYFGAERASNLEKARRRLDLLETLGLPSRGRVLDVGCSDGTFVESAAERGHAAYGIEVSAEALARIPADTRARVAPSYTEAAAWAPFDCVTFWDVLEHLPDPQEALREAKRLLVPGGIVGVCVPVIDNLNARLLPRTWDQYKPPEHLWYFSRKSMRQLLSSEIGPVAFEETAWRRESRLFDVALSFNRHVGRPLVWAEGLLSRACIRAGLIPETMLDDSVLVFARCSTV